MTMPDVLVENHGSLYLMWPQTDSAQEWIDEHIPEDAQWFGSALVIEPRYVEDVAHGMMEDGLRLN
jgi:hypothetical protein